MRENHISFKRSNLIHNQKMSLPPSKETALGTSEPRFPSVMSAFQDWVKDLAEEQEIKEAIRNRVRELEASGRELAALLQKVHHASGYSNLPAVISEVELVFESKIQDHFKELAEVVPPGQYFRYHYMYNVTIQRFVYQAALTHYLKTEDLLLLADAAKMLGIKHTSYEPKANTNEKLSGDDEKEVKSCKLDVFHLDLEDYLAGITQLSNELSRLVVNAVTHGDYQRPKRIATFLNNLDGGFRLLNLKNDMLRKKFDSLKYDLKKVEEVVYDLSIRGLLKEN